LVQDSIAERVIPLASETGVKLYFYAVYITITSDSIDSLRRVVSLIVEVAQDYYPGLLVYLLVEFYVNFHFVLTLSF